jgi:hypothetical protein
MRPLLLALLLATPAALASPYALCDDDASSCRETCSLELGTKLDQRATLARCLQRCEDGRAGCRRRVELAQRAKPQPRPDAGMPKVIELPTGPAPSATASEED